MELKNFILSHDNWEELLTTEPYNLKVSRDNGYILFKYDQIASDFNIHLVREARGIIFRESDWKCVCFPFTKFGNWGENYCPDIDWSTASVQEKVDGSLIKIWWDNDWHISTNGTIDAFKSETGDIKYPNYGTLVIEAIRQVFPNIDIFFGKLAKEAIYMFELVSPYTRVVIPYEEIKLYFLGWRDRISNDESMPEYSIVSSYFDIPERYSLSSLEDVQKAASKLSWNEEGYVVCDFNFNRVKIKSPQYVTAHYMRSNNTINTERLVQIVLDGEREEFLIYASDYADELHKVEEAMHEIAQSSVDALYGMHDYIPIERKDYAWIVNQHSNYMKDFLFHCYDEKIFWDYAKSWTAAKWVKAIEELKGE